MWGSLRHGNSDAVKGPSSRTHKPPTAGSPPSVTRSMPVRGEKFPLPTGLPAPTYNGKRPWMQWVPESDRLEAHSAKSCPTCCGTISPKWKWHCSCLPDSTFPVPAHWPLTEGQTAVATVVRGLWGGSWMGLWESGNMGWAVENPSWEVLSGGIVHGPRLQALGACFITPSDFVYKK